MLRVLVRAALIFFCIFQIPSVFAVSGDTIAQDDVLSDDEFRLAIQKILQPEVIVGEVTLADGKIKVNTPPGYYLLSKSGANFVLEDLWGNLHDDTVLGILVPSGFPGEGKVW